MSLTGVQAPLDTPGVKGAEVAVKYLNDNGGLLGKQVELINVDGKSDPVTVGNVAVELIDKGADLIMAPCDFDFGGPASREAQTAGLVGISTCASDPLYSSWSLGDKQFTLSMWNTTMGATAADFAFKEKGWKTAYVVTDQFIAYTKSLSKYFVEQFKANGGEIILEDTYTNGDNDFSAQLARLQALGKKPDVIFISSYGQDIGAIIRALREVGYDAPVLGGDAYDDPAMHAALGETLGNDVFFVTHTFMTPEAHPDMEKFIELYTEMHGGAPDTAFVATGWDTVMMMAEAVKAAGSHRRRGSGQGAGGGQVQAAHRRPRLRHRRRRPRAEQGGRDGRAEGRQADLPRLAPARDAAGALIRMHAPASAGARSLLRNPDAGPVAQRHRRLGRVRRAARARRRVAGASPGEIVGLIGPNGSGKTTLVNAITGQVPLAGGRVTLGEETISGLPPRQVALRGIARSFQIVRLFNNLTVAENVEAAALARGDGLRRGQPPRPRSCLPSSACRRRADDLGAQPELRRQAPRRDRPRARCRSVLPAARRAGRRHERGGDRDAARNARRACRPRAASAC